MKILPNHDGKHVWRFFRAGGTDQVRLDEAADLLALGELDQKLWVALSCPVKGLEFDEDTLRLLDLDGDGRIRAPEIIAAVQWLSRCLKDVAAIKQEQDCLPLAAINDAEDEGRRLLALAREMLRALGKSDAPAISVSDVADQEKFMAATRFNGDGVVTAESADDGFTKEVIADIQKCLGAVSDRSGKPGIGAEQAERFFKEAEALGRWWSRRSAEAEILPLGERTAEAFAALQGVRGKVEDYFARCKTAAFDPRAASALNRQEGEYAALAAKELSAGVPELSGFPLARVEAERPLPLEEGINPAWAAAMARLKSFAVIPLLGEKTALTEQDLRRLIARLGAHEAWLAEKPASPVESLGMERVAAILESPARDTIKALIARDLEFKHQFESLTQLDKLVRLHRDLYRLLNNFVSFADFYGRRRKALFQAGTLYLDGRSCELCVRVSDPARHAALATLSRMFLAYCECSRPGGPEKMTIAAAVTGGDSDNLMVGRNGIFYDRSGRDWDATIVKLVEHPISIRQAFWAPYKKVARLVEDQIAKLAAEHQKTVDEHAATHLDAAAKAAPPKKEPFDVAKFAGIFAAIGLAMGAMGAALGAVVAAFSKLALWQVPLAMGGIILLISGPSMIIAALKLRQRNLGPILDANGWAVNAMVRINIPFGGALTGVARLPRNAERTLEDPYAEKSQAPKWIALSALVLLSLAGYYVCRRWIFH